MKKQLSPLDHLFATRQQSTPELCHLAGVARSDLPALLSIHPATVRRWQLHDTWPVPVRVALAALAGFFPWHGWHGFYLEDGRLYPPEYRHGYTASDIKGLWYYRQYCEREARARR